MLHRNSTSTSAGIPAYKKSLFSASATQTGKRQYWLLPLLICLLFSNTVLAHDKYNSVKIYLPKNIEQRNDLLGYLEIDHFEENQGAIITQLDDASLLKLKAYKCKYEIISRDAVADLVTENQKYYSSLTKGNTSSANRVAFEQNGQTVNNIITTPAAFQVKSTLGGYYSFAEMNTAMDNLVAAYPVIAQKFSIGKTVEGRDMWCIKISDNVATDDTDEPEVLFMGLHHAREAIGGASMIFLMQYLCENYATNSTIRNLVNNREFFIIPCVNPDGWEYNRSTNPNGGGQWRKNRSKNSDGTFGVDLNRNWGIDWANCTGAKGASSCGSSSGSSDVYWGKAAFSEPETVNLRNFVQSRHFAVCMDQHSVGPYYSLPFGRLTRTLSNLDNQVYTQVTSIMGKYNGMRYGNTYQTLGYEVSGGMKDWLLIGDTARIGKIYGMTGEGSNGSSTVQFWPKAAEIITLCKGMIYQDLQIAYTAGSYVDFQDCGKLNISASNGKFYFKVRRIGLQNKPVTISVIPIQNIASVGNPVTITSLSAFNSTYKDSISYTLTPGLNSGQSIKFAWKVETGGYTYYDTVINVINPTILFTDDMEAASVTSKWTVGSSWAYTTDAAYTGTKSLAESPAANYTNSSTRLITCKTSLNLTTAKSAYISFWVKNRCENFRDKLQLQVSTNGSTWVAISGLTTIKEPGTNDGSTINGVASMTGIRENWTREIFDISSYAGTAALQFRFQFTSDASSSYAYGVDQGFNIDDIIAISSPISATGLIADNTTMSLQGQSADTKNVLQLDISNPADAKQYVIERSTNGVDYEFLDAKNAKINSAGGLTFTDNNPYEGENLYRVRVDNTDGTKRYTNLVALSARKATLLPTGIDKIYPNPASANMTIQFSLKEEQAMFTLNVFNLSGQIVHSEVLRLNAGQNSIPLDATEFASGEYFISITNPETRVSYETKFMKL